MYLRRLVTALGMTSGVVVAATAYAATITPEEFVQKASVANEFEIESSQVALQRSKNSEVKNFAQHMVKDHTKTGEKLKATTPMANNVPKLDEAHEKLLGELKDTSDAKFDSTYIRLQTQAHEDAVDLFRDYSKTGTDKNLQQFAADTLPTLKQHLTKVQQLKAD